MNEYDMSEIIFQAYDLADCILESDELKQYLAAKKALDHDPEAHQLIRELNRKIELFAETERFGHFHPNYHEAKEQVEAYEREMEKNESIHAFKQAEDRLDILLYQVSKTIAHSVSDSIKVPSNNPFPDGEGKKRKKGGCG